MAVVVWDRDDYIQETENQLDDKVIYEEVRNYPQPLIGTIHRAVEKIRKRGDLSDDNIKYFMVKNLNLLGFTFCQKSRRGYRMFQDYLLFQIVDSIQKTFQLF